MVAPLIPAVLIGTGVITGLGGAASAFRGAQKMRRARAEARSAESRYDQELNETRAAVETINTVVCDYRDRRAAPHRMR